jgi:pentatricopeptide repeat protein
VQDTGLSPNTISYNAILLGVCRKWRTDLAIDCFASMVSNGCMPDESTYIILLEGLAYEGFLDEAQELLCKLCSRGILDKSLLIEEEIHCLD